MDIMDKDRVIGLLRQQVREAKFKVFAAQDLASKLPPGGDVEHVTRLLADMRQSAEEVDNYLDTVLLAFLEKLERRSDDGQ